MSIFMNFSTDKRKAVSLAQNFNTQNWKIDISGEIEKPLTLSMEDILKFPLEEGIVFAVLKLGLWWYLG